jgi:predicted TIM-barrel fold metal-dependent hydrolase
MPAADAHVHLFPSGFAGTYGPLVRDEVEVYEQLRAAFAIEQALVVGYEGEERYAGNNDYVLGLARSKPWIVPLAYLEEHEPEVERLRRLQEKGAAGYSIYVRDEQTARRVSSWSSGVTNELDRQQAIISLNATPAAAAALAPFVDAVAGCTLLFSHLGLPGRFARKPRGVDVTARLRPLLALADRPHVNVKFSGLYALSDPAHDFPHLVAQPVVDTLLEVFGVPRLCWGSDFAPALEFISFAQAADGRLLADLGEEDTAAVMGANLRRLLTSRSNKE